MAVKRLSYELSQEVIADKSAAEFELGECEHRRTVFDNLALRELINDNLTKKQKCYIMLYYKDKLTMQQIAKRCGVAKSTVSRTINRGRSRLLSGAKKQEIRRLLR